MTDLKNLRTLAEKATPGPWESWNIDDESIEVRAGSALDGHGSYRLTDMIVEYDVEGFDLDGADFAQRIADADFIAATDPQTVVALIDRLEKAEARVKELRDKHRQTFTALVAVEGRAEKAEAIIERVRAIHKPFRYYEHDAQVLEEAAEDVVNGGRVTWDELPLDPSRGKIQDWLRARAAKLREGQSDG